MSSDYFLYGDEKYNKAEIFKVTKVIKPEHEDFFSYEHKCKMRRRTEGALFTLWVEFKNNRTVKFEYNDIDSLNTAWECI